MLSARPHCSEVRRELEALALGALPARQARAVDRHLATCPACAREALSVGGLLGDLKALSGRLPEPRRRTGAAAALAAGVVALIGLTIAERVPSYSERPPEASAAAMSMDLQGLLASQGPDGAWREPGVASEDFTIGLSGLATLACLQHAGADSRPLAAGQRGCDYLVDALRNRSGADPNASLEVRLRAQAAAAWALDAAARHWPDRYRREAGKAMRDLRGLTESWAGAERGSAPSDVANLLVSAAWRGSHERPGTPDAGGDSRRVVAQLVAALGSTTERRPDAVTTLAGRAFADAQLTRKFAGF